MLSSLSSMKRGFLFFYLFLFFEAIPIESEASQVNAEALGILPRLAVNQLFFLEQLGSWGNYFRDTHYENTQVYTADGEMLKAHWIETEAGGKTVIFFHGNAMTCGRTFPFLQWYAEHGFNALSVTIRGYPGSTGSSVLSGEKGVLLDVEAAVRFVLKNQGVPHDKVLVHGLSLGGAYAMTAGLYFNLPVVLDRPFTSPGAAVQHFLARRKSPAYYIGLFDEYFGKGNSMPAVGLYREFGHEMLVFDGLNNVEKAKALKSELFVIYAEADEVMPHSFSKELIEARYGEGAVDRLRDHSLFEIKKGTHRHPPFFQMQPLADRLGEFYTTQLR